MPDREKKIDRKTFLRMGYHAILKAVSTVVEGGMNILNRRRFIRPPGAVEESVFLALCDLCGKCWEACPHWAIRQVEGGGLEDGTPAIFPAKAPCYLCDPPECSRVCPKGALEPLRSRDEIKIGIAIVRKGLCLAYRGIDKGCDYCYDRCPLKDKAITFNTGPVVIEDACSGCGICEFFCVSNPKAITISPL